MCAMRWRELLSTQGIEDRGIALKILVDARALGKRPSGVGMYLYNFLRGLQPYEQIQLELLTDVAESAEIKELEAADIPIHKYGKPIEKSVGVYAYFRFVQKIIYEVKPDIFWEGNNLIPVKLKNPYGKVIVTIHDVFPITVPEGYGKVYQYYFRLNLWKTLRNVDAVLYNSIETKKEAERVMPRAKCKESFVSYIVVDITPKTEISDEGYFLYIGNLEKRKGTDILLHAYKLYRSHGGEKNLILTGKIREKEIEELYERTCKEVNGIIYVGYAEEEQKDKLLAKCGCFVFPSRAEGFGIPVIEALNYEKPVIGSDLSIFSEIADGQIQSFVLDASVQKAAANLADQMLDIKSVNAECVQSCVEKYRGTILIQALKGYFDKIVG